MRDENNRTDGPSSEVVVQDIQIGRAVFDYGALHFGVGGIEDFGTERFGLALQLKWLGAAWAGVVQGGGISRRDIEFRRVARGTEEICGAPRFGADASALGGTFVAVEAGSGKAEVHAKIRS